MRVEELLLLLLPPAIIVGVPVYILFRERMVRKRKDNPDYSRKRIVKLTFVNFILNVLATLYSFSIFAMIALRSFAITPTNIFLTIVFGAIVNLTFYGNGIYLTSIVLENYTIADLRKSPKFDTQFIATHLFHGPISHVFIYSGWLFVLLTISVIDLLNAPVKTLTNPVLMTLAGGSLGIFYGISQIYNGTVPYQFISGLVALVVFLALIVWKNIAVSQFAVSSYFLGFILMFLLTLIGYFVFQMIKGKNVNWDQSGY